MFCNVFFKEATYLVYRCQLVWLLFYIFMVADLRDEWQMRNEKWQMANDKWEMTNDKWEKNK